MGPVQGHFSQYAWEWLVTLEGASHSAIPHSVLSSQFSVSLVFVSWISCRSCTTPCCLPATIGFQVTGSYISLLFGSVSWSFEFLCSFNRWCTFALCLHVHSCLHVDICLSVCVFVLSCVCMSAYNIPICLGIWTSSALRAPDAHMARCCNYKEAHWWQWPLSLGDGEREGGGEVKGGGRQSMMCFFVAPQPVTLTSQ